MLETLFMLVIVYLTMGTCNILGKYLSSRNPSTSFSITRQNWWKSIILWPIELGRIIDRGHNGAF